MKVEIINDEDLDIYINPYNFNDINCYDRENIMTVSEALKNAIL